MTQRQVDAGARLQEAEAALARAPEDDARRLADWLAGGEKGERPPASLYERQRDRDAARLLVEAAPRSRSTGRSSGAYSTSSGTSRR